MPINSTNQEITIRGTLFIAMKNNLHCGIAVISNIIVKDVCCLKLISGFAVYWLTLLKTSFDNPWLIIVNTEYCQTK